MREFTISFLLSLLIILSSVTTATATNTVQYELDDMNMSIEIPSNMTVFTRDIASDDPNLELFSITKEYLLSLYQNNDIYLEAYSLDPYYEIIITMLNYDGSQEIFDFKNYSDEELLSMGEEMLSYLEEDGRIYGSVEIYRHPDAIFLKMPLEQEDDGQTIYSVQYYTIREGTSHQYHTTLIWRQDQFRFGNAD